ncbi:uncharacterized protein LOC117640395 [Thrips palmi]|uniref:Uncharacterized protein LOC117640395 n=1 Tax=Thrips palmi TaxID=161013 RepID=A0A6P8ZI05_THRPL|nr:uncharacterized protein LOC117640395 [Thrips palmi]
MGPVCIEAHLPSVPLDVAAEEPVTVRVETDSEKGENQPSKNAAQEENPPPKSSQSKNVAAIAQKISQQRVSKLSVLKEAGVEKDGLSDDASKLLRVAHMYKSRLARSEKKLKEANSRLVDLEKPESHARVLSDKISPALNVLLKGELLNGSRHPRGRDWCEESKCLSLVIKSCSRKTYSLLEKMFVLPSSRTIQNVLSRIPLEPGINEGFFDHLARQVETMTPKEKFVSLNWDEFRGQGGLFFNEKKGIIIGFENFGSFGNSNLPADEYLIFLIRSLGPNSNWKMPLAIFFSLSMCPGEILKKMIVLIITKLQNIGLRVAATVCDQGPANQKAMRLLHEEAAKKTGRVEEPEIIVNGQTIVTFWDNPHVFKNIINNWRLDIHNCIEYGPQCKRAYYQHIIDYYEYDKKNFKVGLLTHEQVYPEGKQKMKVKNCTQVAGATVANTIKSYNQLSSHNGGNPILPGADDTANFMLKVDYLFDITNGSAPGDKPKPEQRALVTETSFHHEAWKEMRKEVATWAYIDKEGKRVIIPCLKACQDNLLAYPALWRFLKKEGQYTSLNLRHVTQDCLGNFISQMRATLGPNTHPTCYQVMNAFRTQLINKHVNFSLQKGKNCQDDGAQMLTDMQRLINNKKTLSSDKDESVAGPSQLRAGLETFSHITRGLRAPQIAIEEKFMKANAVIENSAMGAALLARQCLDGNSCRLCENVYTESDPHDSVLKMLKKCGEYHKMQKSVPTPSFHLVQVYQAMTDKFNYIAKTHLDPANMLPRVMVALDDHDFFTDQCPLHGPEMRNKTVQLASRLLIKNYCKRYSAHWEEEKKKIMQCKQAMKKSEKEAKVPKNGGGGRGKKQVEKAATNAPPQPPLPVCELAARQPVCPASRPQQVATPRMPPAATEPPVPVQQTVSRRLQILHQAYNTPVRPRVNAIQQQRAASCTLVPRVMSPVQHTLGRGQIRAVQAAHQVVPPVGRGGTGLQLVAGPRMPAPRIATPATQLHVPVQQPVSRTQQILQQAYETPVPPRVNAILHQRPASCTVVPRVMSPVQHTLGRGQIRAVQAAHQVVPPIARPGPVPRLQLLATPTVPSASAQPPVGSDRQPTAKRKLLQSFVLGPQPTKKKR